MTNAPTRALIVVDVQREYFDGALPIGHPPRERSLARILQAIDAADAAGIPVVLVQHEHPAGAPAFAAGSPLQRLHPDVEARVRPAHHRIVKRFASVFDGTGLRERLAERGVDTVTLVGYMTNNCIVASAAAAPALGLRAEVLEDATGAVGLRNDAGKTSSRQVHEVLMTLLASNFAAVASSEAWIRALGAGTALPKSTLIASATDS